MAMDKTQIKAVASQTVYDVIGQTKADAVKIIKSRELRSRVLSEDGMQYAGTRDFRRDRINLEIIDGKVTDARVG